LAEEFIPPARRAAEKAARDFIAHVTTTCSSACSGSKEPSTRSSIRRGPASTPPNSPGVETLSASDVPPYWSRSREEYLCGSCKLPLSELPRSYPQRPSGRCVGRGQTAWLSQALLGALVAAIAIVAAVLAFIALAVVGLLSSLVARPKPTRSPRRR
jgi:hypothetical protein